MIHGLYFFALALQELILKEGKAVITSQDALSRQSAIIEELKDTIGTLGRLLSEQRSKN